MEQIKSYSSPKTEVRGSQVEGVGLFAKEDIKKGEIVFIKAGHIVGLEETLKLNKDIGEYDTQITDDFFLCPKSKDEIENLAIHFNHSCDPNAGPDGQVSFVALRDIKSGEEITCDYGSFQTYPYRLECNCGSKNCRKVITGDDWESPELQNRYGNNFSWFILKKIKKL